VRYGGGAVRYGTVVNKVQCGTVENRWYNEAVCYKLMSSGLTEAQSANFAPGLEYWKVGSLGLLLSASKAGTDTVDSSRIGDKRVLRRGCSGRWMVAVSSSGLELSNSCP